MPIPSYATAMVSNWRRIAEIPESVPDDLIYKIVMRESLHVSLGKSDEENQGEIDYLRQELGLENSKT